MKSGCRAPSATIQVLLIIAYYVMHYYTDTLAEPGLHGIRKIHQDQLIDVTTRDLNLDFDVYPKKYAHITDNEYFNRYILIKQIRKSNAENSNLSIGEQLISDISSLTISSIRGERSEPNPTVASLNALNNSQKCAYYENYYKDVYEDYTVYKAIENNDFYPFEGDEYDYYNDSHLRFTAKVILKCKMFENPTFGNTELKFMTLLKRVVTVPYLMEELIKSMDQMSHLKILNN